MSSPPKKTENGGGSTFSNPSFIRVFCVIWIYWGYATTPIQPNGKKLFKLKEKTKKCFFFKRKKHVCFLLLNKEKFVPETKKFFPPRSGGSLFMEERQSFDDFPTKWGQEETIGRIK